jgi:hypothetical protein
MTTHHAATAEPVTVEHRSRRRKIVLLVTGALVVAVMAVVGSISTRHRADERRRLELADVVGRYDVAVTRHEWVALEPLLAPAFVFHNVEYGARQDRAGFLAWATTIGDSYPDFEISVDDAEFHGELVNVRFHEGAVGVAGVVRMRVVARQIVEMWSDYAEFGLRHDRAPTVVG